VGAGAPGQRQWDRGERRVFRTRVRIGHARLRLRSEQGRHERRPGPLDHGRGGQRHRCRIGSGILPPQASATARWRRRWTSL